jgi:hypothetical protein
VNREYALPAFGYLEDATGQLSQGGVPMKPLKVKIFTHCTQHINPFNEAQLNEWLAQNPAVEIVHLLQSESMVVVKNDQVERNLSITLFFRES